VAERLHGIEESDVSSPDQTTPSQGISLIRDHADTTGRIQPSASSFNPRSRNRNRGGHSQILTLIWKTTGPYDSEQHRFHRHRSSGVPTPWSGPSHATSLTIGASYRNRSRPTRTCPRSARNSPVHHHISSSLSDIESRDEVNEDTARERLRDERLRIEKLLDQTTTDGLDDRASAGEQGDMTDPAGPLIAEQEEERRFSRTSARDCDHRKGGATFD